MDRKLDAWIAVNVFGYEVVREKPYKRLYGDGVNIPYFAVKHYTSDMNEAVKVLEISSMVLPGFYSFYDYCKVEDMDGNTLALAKISQPALAICLAAYKLKTGEDWNE